MRHQVDAACVEFDEGGTTIWVQSPQGATILRIKCDKITVSKGCVNSVAHADVWIKGEIDVCMPDEPEPKP